MDHQKCRTFTSIHIGCWRTDVNADFCKELTLRDEIHFNLNLQNCHIVKINTPKKADILKKKRSVWCTLWTAGITDSYFFKDKAGDADIVSGILFRDVLNNLNLDDIRLQQGQATMLYST